jgi:hypothetical protein
MNTTYAILETSQVPSGSEPTVICYEDTFEEAKSTIEHLRKIDALGFYEMCEA